MSAIIENNSFDGPHVDNAQTDMKTKPLSRPQNKNGNSRRCRGLPQPTTMLTTKEVHARKEHTTAEALPAFTSSSMEAGTPRGRHTTEVVCTAGPRCLSRPPPPTIEAPNTVAPKGPYLMSKTKALRYGTPSPPPQTNVASPPGGLPDLPPK
jgi:hypothetical protein